MNIYIGADHRGFVLKEQLKQQLLPDNIIDIGTNNEERCDYPLIVHDLASRIKENDRAILICGSAIGMSIAANRYGQIRAALCMNEQMAKLARQHNDANVIIFGADFIDADMAIKCYEVFMKTEFEGGRYQQRIELMTGRKMESYLNRDLAIADEQLKAFIDLELKRQQSQIELIASENFVSKAVLEAAGTVLTNKYAEGYPGKRYYGGCEFVDEVETLAINRLKTLFGCSYANVQPHSGSQANQAVYLAFAKPGDTILGMSLSAGGHLTHGAAPNQSGKWFNAVAYGVRKDNGLIDYDEVETLAREHKPKLIIAGGSAYPRAIDFKKFREIADMVGALLWVDMAHIAGLIAVGEHPELFPHAHIVTSTTHKT